ncbi:hypothetical protein K7X08_021923 [Anisodus acutangulus]|uniref:Amine oxidase domain-containing protein n=1 Tax=Anisodus acutangulus TaxID=402998 RepID=A0A9Q1L3U2_9SOLA|nr:hypothetical protein K7X08_021923 [Anisodus acutangulus]
MLKYLKIGLENHLKGGFFSMYENIHRHYSAAGDLGTLDFNGESEYCNFPGDDLTIAKGYSKVIESLASVLSPGMIQLGRKVAKIEWQSGNCCLDLENGDSTKPVKLHFRDGSVIPPLPSFKAQEISRLGFGVVDKLFLQLSPNHDENVGYDEMDFPNMRMVFHPSGAHLSHPKIPLWIRRTALIHPIYPKSSVLVSWFAGEEALEVDNLDDEEIINGVSTTMSQFLANSKHFKNSNSIKFSKILKCKWGTDPLFLGSYSYIAVGSSGDDFDAIAEPLPKGNLQNSLNFKCYFQVTTTSS